MNLEQARYFRGFLDAHGQRAAYWLSSHEAAERRRVAEGRMPRGAYQLGSRLEAPNKIDGLQMTYEEIGALEGVQRTTICQIVSKALRKLRHPTRTKFLRDFSDGHEAVTRVISQARRKRHLDELDWLGVPYWRRS